MRKGSFIQDDQNNPEMGFSQCLQYKMQFYWLDYKIFVGSLAAIKFHPFDQQYPKAHCLSRCWEILLWTCRKDWLFFFLQSVSLEEFRLGLLFKRIYLGDGPKSRQRESWKQTFVIYCPKTEQIRFSKPHIDLQYIQCDAVEMAT